jgi:serine phosphatase RsbU (regulator of sigma subunit)/anti-sigma regulatory factor (Ser/Thr protein kinase)
MVRSLDRSAEERLDRALGILVEAGNALQLCRTIDEALSRIAACVVDTLADYCSIETAADALGGKPFRVAVGDESGAAHAPQNTIVESINDGRTILGTIACRSLSPDGLDEMARKVVRLLAIELGAVLSGRLLMHRERRVADRLQRALLPEHLPEVPGAFFHGAYRPASDEAEVGGDWFDAFHLPDRRIAISIGDVAGHGLDAAVIMGEVRQAIRTAAVAAATPGAVLEQVNRIISLRDSIGIVTAVFGIYDPTESVLSYAVAGHPPPLIALSNGLVRQLPSGSLPLGCVDALDCKEWTFTIPAGAHAVFYTDGLIENEHDLVRGEKRLVEAVRSFLRDGDESWAADPATALQERIFENASNRDDAAVLVLSRKAPVASYVFSAVPVVATIARALVADEIAALEVDEQRRFGILVALGEALANAIEHAYRDGTGGVIRLDITTQDDELVLTVEDYGRWRPFVRRDERGRGFELMHAFMDGVQVRSTRESTRILLKAHLTSLSP